MKLSEEEKKAIEKVKEVIKIDKERRIITKYDDKPLFRDQLQIILNLIDKQQKEIEELKEITREYNAFNGAIEDRIIIADCLLLINQFKAFYQIKDKDIQKVYDYKIARQEERMKNE